jgi:hypothetical protein
LGASLERRSLKLSAGFGARFEKVEQGAVLEQQLLSAERQSPCGASADCGTIDNGDY